MTSLTYKIPVIIDPSFEVFIEPTAGVLWVHCDVFCLNHSSFKRMKEKWEEFTKRLNSDLFVLYSPETALPSLRYISSFGFSFHKDVITKEGKPYQIWKRGK